ncbi:MAG: replication restart helicase PriA, partial [Candidatus Binatia bacterium]
MSHTKIFSPYPFATVAVTVPVGPQGVLTYRIPESLRSRLTPGMRVLVPVGKRKITGIITNLSPSTDLQDPEKIKDILSVLDEEPVLPPDLLRLWQWASGYYLASPAETLSTILPGGLRSESVVVVRLKKKSKVQSSKSKVQSLEEEQSTPQSLDLSDTEQKILALLADKKRVTTKMLRQHFPTLHLEKVLRKLESLGVVEVGERLSRVENSSAALPPLSEACPEPSGKITEDDEPTFALSAAQAYAREQMREALQTTTFRVFLVHGVTGSGKTEVYLQAAQEAVSHDKGVLILVPEIALTHQLVEQVRQRFGTRVAVLHSAMAVRERWAEWQRIARGEATVVVGVRSAVFAPLAHLGLIVVDEEHDPAYKQEEGIRYNARDLAIMRGKLACCPIILGSATPSLETYVHSRARRYTLIELPERVESRQLPTVEIVDLRQEARAGNTDKIFSAALRQALIDNHQAGKQSLLFLNRRGYSRYLQCRLCGEVLSCTRCSVTLTFHLRGRILLCHYCGLTQQAPDRCPRCSEPALEGCGVGTEQVETTLNSFLPGVRVARLDRDSVSRRGTLERVLSAWHSHDIDVLVGTQMVTKGHDVPGVTLVGVLLADVSLNLPDFRAAERTFQLLAQVAGRAGRGLEPGRVIIQTYAPQHYSIRCAARHNFVRFAVQELRYRKRLGYPPFTRIVNIRLEGKEGEKVRAAAERLAQKLMGDAQRGEKMPMILGPA